MRAYWHNNAYNCLVMWSAAHPEEKYDSPDEWLDQFNTFSIYQILPELIDLWGMNIKTTVLARKNLGRQSGR